MIRPIMSPIRVPPIPLRWFIVIGLLVVMVTVPSSSAVDPLLYTARNESTTVYHQDLMVTGENSRSDATRIIQEWSTSLNLTAQVLHNIKIRDFSLAQSDFQMFNESGQTLRLLVIRLDLEETEVAVFENANEDNVNSLKDLQVQIQEFDDLGTGEETLFAQRNISGLKAIELQGEDLRTSIRKNFDGYVERSGRVISISKRFGLDTSVFEQSVIDFTAIMAEIDTVQEKRSSSIQDMIQEIRSTSDAEGTNETVSAIHLEIHPNHGVYGDTLQMMGTVDAPAGTKVGVIVDGRHIGDNTTRTDGHFSIPYMIEKVEARTHTAYASIDSDISEMSNFTVTSRNTIISLEVHAAEGASKKCIGTGRLVTEDGIPVRGVRVYMDLDSRSSWGYGTTGTDGNYTITSELLSPGTHRLNARFEPEGVPLNRSASKPVTVVVSSHLTWVTSLVYLLGIGVAAVGGVLFLRRRQPTEDPSAPVRVEVARARERGKPPVRTIEEAHRLADEFTVTTEEGVDGYATIAKTYIGLVQELEAKNPHLRLHSLTPRKLAAQFSDLPYGEPLAEIVRIHEKVRYAEHDPTETDFHRVREALIDIVTEGSSH